MDLKKAVNDYFDLQEKIYEYFGYKEDWVVIPLDNRLDDYWMVTGKGEMDDKYVYSSVPLTQESVESGDKIYGGRIYTQRFLPKWVYRGKDYTLVCADTQTDGNKFLMVFSNDKECKDTKLKKLYVDKWGKF
jgi:hypothetical protein